MQQSNDGIDGIRELYPYVIVVDNAPRHPQEREALSRRIGRKAAGLSVLPPSWTPPFVVLDARFFADWRLLPEAEARNLIEEVAHSVADVARQWTSDWDRGITVRSSATEETLRERGANHSVELAADFDGPMIARAISQVFDPFVASQHSGQMAILIQARFSHTELGHISNERRVSKTINQWMWEYEPSERDGGRFNSQRENVPDLAQSLWISSHRREKLVPIFRAVGKWCSSLEAGRTHLEWGASANSFWIFQLDFEDDQPDNGVDPSNLLRNGDLKPSGDVPAGSPFTIAPLDGTSGWPKIDKVSAFLPDRELPYPKLIYLTGDRFKAARLANYDLAHDLDLFAHGRIVCRTDCNAEGVNRLNLPRTNTIGSNDAVQFMERTLANMENDGVYPKDVCFILHKFIPAIAAAWAVARKGEQIVRVDSSWGLPDGLQFLPHDTFEFDVRRGEMSTERTRYKHAFLQEIEGGNWEVVRVMRKATRWRSLPSSDLAEVARRTHEISNRLGRDLQIMWFCRIPTEENIGSNIPWFSMPPAEHAPSVKRVSPGKIRFNIRSMEDIEAARNAVTAKHILQVDPDDPELFRSKDFLDGIISVAQEKNVPVGLTGSILGHAFYILEKEGVTVVASDEPSRSRTRQRRVFRKLVRDDIPVRISEGGETVTLAEIAKNETRAALVTKLLEEAYEMLRADSPQDVTAELADMLEVVRSLSYATGVEWDDVVRSADSKRVARGGFEKNIVLLETSWPGWLEEGRQSKSFTIPLSKLGQIKSDAVSSTIPFALLFASGAKPKVQLPDGSQVEVSMDAEGVRVSRIDTAIASEHQFKLDL